MKRRLAALAGLLWVLPGQATAHLVSTRFGELYSGMLHPVMTLQHLLPWVALGLLSGLQSTTTVRWALLAFPVSVLAGVTLAGVVPSLAFVAPLNVFSFVVLGLLVALRTTLGTSLFLSLAVLVGLSHGYANAALALKGFAWTLYAMGVGITAYLLITLVSGSVNALATGPVWGTIAVRAAGSWIAAAGIVYAGFVLTT